MRSRGCLDDKKWKWKNEKQGFSNEEKSGCQSCWEGTMRKGGPQEEEGGTGIRNGENPWWQAGTGWNQLRGTARQGSDFIFARFTICLKRKGLSRPLIYANRQHPGCGPERPVGLERRVGLIFWVLSLPREEPAAEFCGFKKEILSLYKREGMSLRSWRSWGYITIKCLGA